MSETTRNKILSAAETLFAKDGFSTTSLRNIIGKAKVNLAAIHYHFGSKQGLVEAVIVRSIEPINTERVRLLEELGNKAGKGNIPLESIIEAFVSPPLRARSNNENLVLLMGRLHSELDSLEEILHKQFQEVFQKFMGAFAQALPKVSSPQLNWKFFFMLGGLAFIMSHNCKHIFADDDPKGDTDALIKRYVSFAAGGLRAQCTE